MLMSRKDAYSGGKRGRHRHQQQHQRQNRQPTTATTDHVTSDRRHITDI